MDEIQVLGHSLLSPSAANRWFNCQRSVRAYEKFPDEGSVFASEGTEAHRLCQFLLNTAIGRHDVDPRHIWISRPTRRSQRRSIILPAGAAKYRTGAL